MNERSQVVHLPEVSFKPRGDRLVPGPDRSSLQIGTKHEMTLIRLLTKFGLIRNGASYQRASENGTELAIIGGAQVKLERGAWRGPAIRLCPNRKRKLNEPPIFTPRRKGARLEQDPARTTSSHFYKHTISFDGSEN